MSEVKLLKQIRETTDELDRLRKLRRRLIVKAVRRGVGEGRIRKAARIRVAPGFEYYRAIARGDHDG